MAYLSLAASACCKMAVKRKKKHYLPKLIKGEIRMSISMTEPDAGNMRTLAVADGHSWGINGHQHTREVNAGSACSRG